MIAGRALGRELAQAQQVLHAEKKAGAADPADQNRDLHIRRPYADTPRAELAAVPSKNGHEMVWKSSQSLDHG
ncbi:hypothetical protein MBRA_03600 [Mycobacterium branderi]|uniref:Transposase n=1 Tax=Mycobacterium branderi TaxID=43348 RepID=A0ABM7KGR3_9MYCO|nr:hypothetical protein MBRA_03600 [Mycobacterium branderi]